MFKRRRRSQKSQPPARIVSTEIAAEARLGFDYILKQSSRRKTLSLQVKAGCVEVAAPEKMPATQAHAFVEEKQQWVLRKLEEQHQRLAEEASYEFVEGEHFPFMGETYSLVLGRAPLTQVHILRDRQVLYVLLGNRSRKPQHEQIKQALQQWYRDQAERILTEKTLALANRIGVTVAAIKLRQTRSKWGHCTRDGVIQYNWLIMQAPEPVIDYLVAHEVSHRVHLNHGKRFWNKVASVCPNYEQQRTWLREKSHRLGL